MIRNSLIKFVLDNNVNSISPKKLELTMFLIDFNKFKEENKYVFSGKWDIKNEYPVMQEGCQKKFFSAFNMGNNILGVEQPSHTAVFDSKLVTLINFTYHQYPIKELKRKVREIVENCDKSKPIIFYSTNKNCNKKIIDETHAQIILARNFCRTSNKNVKYNRNEIRVYFCEICKGHHLTSLSQSPLNAHRLVS